jgi:hypothetical protein
MHARMCRRVRSCVCEECEDWFEGWVRGLIVGGLRGWLRVLKVFVGGGDGFFGVLGGRTMS